MNGGRAGPPFLFRDKARGGVSRGGIGGRGRGCHEKDKYEMGLRSLTQGKGPPKTQQQ